MLPIVCLSRLLLQGHIAILATSISNGKMPQLRSPSENNALDSGVITVLVIKMPRKDETGSHSQHRFRYCWTEMYLISSI